MALAASALVKAGRADLLRSWLPGLARSANQGPYSQAHFVENYAAPVDGGARKAPTEWPYINDWAILCAGGFFDTILLDLFGLEFGYAQLGMKPQLSLIDPEAVLENVPYQGKLHRVTANASVP